MNKYNFLHLITAAAVLALQGCGGGGGGTSEPPPTQPSPPPPTSSQPSTPQPPTSTSISAATATANNNAMCTAIAPFHWEIGDKNGSMVSGNTGDGSVTETTPLLLASASKWIFGAYLTQLRGGNVTAADIKALTMNTGYTSLVYAACLRALPSTQAAETVDQCFTSGTNNTYTAANDGKFHYDGGHFQWYADTALGLGGDNSTALTTAVAAQVGQDFSFSYDSPQLAGGAKSTAADYAIFLRKMLNGQLVISSLLGADAVCTNPTTCPTSTYAPIPSTESWHYSLAHWVEDDPVVGDGSFSSPGAFGFYPWIDHSKTYYGILARYATNTGGTLATAPYYQSVQCGRVIRKAWSTGVQQ